MNYAERVLERGPNGQVIRSELVPMSEAVNDPSCVNPCGHVGVRSEDMWPYTVVICSVCGHELGTS